MFFALEEGPTNFEFSSRWPAARLSFFVAAQNRSHFIAKKHACVAGRALTNCIVVYCMHPLRCRQIEDFVNRITSLQRSSHSLRATSRQMLFTAFPNSFKPPSVHTSQYKPPGLVEVFPSLQPLAFSPISVRLPRWFAPSA